VTASLINANCEESCSRTNEGNPTEITKCVNSKCTEISNNFSILNYAYTFKNLLEPCVNYRYEIMQLSEIKANGSTKANVKHQKVMNMHAFSELVSENEYEIELFVMWEYQYEACPQTFVVYVSYK
jgi:hypothetical protein